MDGAIVDGANKNRLPLVKGGGGIPPSSAFLNNSSSPYQGEDTGGVGFDRIKGK